MYDKVVIIMGGSSSEREVSLLSGNAVYNSLKKSGINIYKFDPAADSLDSLIHANYSKAIIMIHGIGGEDGTLQGLMEYLKIPYTGSGVMASAIALDKYRTRLIWQALNIPVAHGQYIQQTNLANFKLEINLPVIIKPLNQGSTIGINKVYNIDQLEEKLRLAFKFDSEVLIEELIIGAEYTITLDEKNIYPIIKIEAENNYDYQNKYFTDTTKYSPCHSLDNTQINDFARLAYSSIKVRGIARIDIMIDKNNKIYFLEINTIPGMTNHSLVPLAFNEVGCDFDQLCLKILSQATLGR